MPRSGRVGWEEGAGMDIPVEGVRSVSHTADVGIDVEAPDLPTLLARSALGMAWLILEHDPPEPGETRALEVEGPDAPSLLREWLRELLYWHESEGFCPTRFRFLEVDPTHCVAEVDGGPDACDPVREIKGVTLHDLRAEETPEGWTGRVIFDV